MKLLYQLLHMKRQCACVKNAERHHDVLMCRKCGEIIGFVYSSKYLGDYDSIHLHPEYKPYKTSLPKNILEIERRNIIT